MASSALLPPERNTTSQNRTVPHTWLTPPVELQYGQQLSAFTELKEGKKSRSLFCLLAAPDGDKNEPDTDGLAVDK